MRQGPRGEVRLDGGGAAGSHRRMARPLFPLAKAPNASRNGCLGRWKSKTIEPTDPGIWGMSAYTKFRTLPMKSVKITP